MEKKYVQANEKIGILADIIEKNTYINPKLYTEYDVKRGLRDATGKGVLTGLTDISEVTGYEVKDGERIPIDGRLLYRGYNIYDIVKGCREDKRFGFEEIAYLLLLNKLPNDEELKEFNKILGVYRSLPDSFLRDIIMKAPSDDMMNAMSRCVLMLYSYDRAPSDLSLSNLLKQSLKMIAQFPMIAVYSYQAFIHYYKDGALYIVPPEPELSTAENILHMLKPDGAYTRLEALTLDIALMLHAEHGGGNNSTFTTRVVTSSGTDTYSAISAALGSLKGPKHGGANIKAHNMFEDMKKVVKDWSDEDEIRDYLMKVLGKQAFDHTGLVYGMGHAIYTKSDPRACVFKEFVRSLAAEKGRSNEFNLYEKVEQIAPAVINEHRRMHKPVCANVDFYSGFAYSMLDIPEELFTPVFAISRITGWSAHRIEEIITANKIIRPAYKSINVCRDYINLKDRD